MNRFRISLCVCLALVSAVSFTGCNKEKEKASFVDNTISYSDSADRAIEKIQIQANIAEEADQNETGFILNSIIDSGHKDEASGTRYVYADMTIKNTSALDYELNMLNNTYILLPDGTQIGYDVRTQLYGTANCDKYVINPFTVPAGGEISGYFGGFLLPEDVNEFTFCFYPTQNDMKNKESVVKVDVKAENIIDGSADFK